METLLLPAPRCLGRYSNTIAANSINLFVENRRLNMTPILAIHHRSLGFDQSSFKSLLMGGSLCSLEALYGECCVKSDVSLRSPI